MREQLGMPRIVYCHAEPGGLSAHCRGIPKLNLCFKASQHLIQLLILSFSGRLSLFTTCICLRLWLYLVTVDIFIPVTFLKVFPTCYSGLQPL